VCARFIGRLCILDFYYCLHDFTDFTPTPAPPANKNVWCIGFTNEREWLFDFYYWLHDFTTTDVTTATPAPPAPPANNTCVCVCVCVCVCSTGITNARERLWRRNTGGMGFNSDFRIRRKEDGQICGTEVLENPQISGTQVLHRGQRACGRREDGQISGTKVLQNLILVVLKYQNTFRSEPSDSRSLALSRSRSLSACVRASALTCVTSGPVPSLGLN
jgi:hypothetical protein